MSNSLCIIVPDLKSGGAQKILHKYGIYETNKNTNVVFVVLFGDNKEFIENNIEYIFLKKSRLIHTIIGLYRLFKVRNFSNVLTSLKHVTIIVELLRYFGFFRFSHTARLANVYTKELDSMRYLKKFIFLLLIKFTHKRIDRFICVSKGVASDLTKYTSRKNICVIYNPIDEKMLKELGNIRVEEVEKNGNYFIFIGRLSKQKNLIFLIKSYYLFLKKYNLNFKLLIIGEGEEFFVLSKLVEDLNLKEWVIFLGFLDNPYPYLRHAKLFLLTSLFEGLPNVLLEARFFEVPIVSIDCQFGPSEIITNSNFGSLVNDYNEYIFSDMIFNVLSRFNDNPILVSEKPSEDKFNIDNIFKSYHNLIFKS